MKNLIVAMAFLVGCDDHIFSGGHHKSVEVTGDGFEAVAAVMANSCANCHFEGATKPDLSANICENTVDVPSDQVSSMNYITAGDPDNSYLLHRMKNTGDTVGGNASPMPPTGVLDDASIQLVEDWIADGANCDELPDDVDTDVDTDTEEPNDTGAVSDTSTGEALITNSCTNACHAGINMGELSSRFPNDGELADVIRGEAPGPMSGIGAAANWTDEEMGSAIAYLRSIE